MRIKYARKLPLFVMGLLYVQLLGRGCIVQRLHSHTQGARPAMSSPRPTDRMWSSRRFCAA